MQTAKTNKQTDERGRIDWFVSDKLIINGIRSKSWGMANGLVRKLLFENKGYLWGFFNHEDNFALLIHRK